MLNEMNQVIEPGQQWMQNRTYKGEVILHVLSCFVDKCGKHKIAVQEETPPRSTYAGRHYYTAKIVTPSYFYGLTVKVQK